MGYTQNNQQGNNEGMTKNVPPRTGHWFIYMANFSSIFKKHLFTHGQFYVAVSCATSKNFKNIAGKWRRERNHKIYSKGIYFNQFNFKKWLLINFYINYWVHISNNLLSQVQPGKIVDYIKFRWSIIAIICKTSFNLLFLLLCIITICMIRLQGNLWSKIALEFNGKSVFPSYK